MSEAQPLVIERISFDCGLIASNVGQVAISASKSMDRCSFSDLIRRADQAGYDLVVLKSAGPLEIEQLQLTGVLLHYDAPIRKTGGEFLRARRRYRSRSLTESDWPFLPGLVRQSSRTRFWNDPNIPEETVVQHKIALLREYASSPSHLASVVEDDAGAIIGFQISYVDGKTLALYEFIIDYRHRSGFVLVELLRSLLVQVEGLPDEPDRITTKIYKDNVGSRRAFERFGLVATGVEDHYYHCWVAQHSAHRTGVTK